MSEIIYDALEKITKRKVYLLDEVENDDNPVPLFLGSKYIGQEVIISGVVKGDDYNDAKSGLEELENEGKTCEEKTILDITGKIKSIKTALKAGSRYQPFVITLEIY